MSGFGKPVKTPTGVGELVLTETGDLLFTASADEVDVQDGCCPFCHSSMEKQKTMPRLLRTAEVLGAFRTGCALQVVHMPLVETKGEEQRSLAHTPWIEFESPEEAVDAQRCIQQANCWTGQSNPRHLLVLLNPASGKGRSKAIWESVKKYICGAAGLRCSVVESEGPNHFIELVSSMDMAQVHGIVIIGGDGTAYEVLQGMLGRADWASVVKIPLAQIPSGSGNALCASLRISDPMHAAFVAIKGCCHPMDAATVLQEPNKRTFSFLTLTTGLLANLDYGTNHLRWMGELRFTLGAIYEILAKRTSTVRVRYLPKDAVQSDRKASVDWELSTPGEDRLGHCDPSYGPTCPVLRSLPDLDFENLGASLSNVGHSLVEAPSLVIRACMHGSQYWQAIVPSLLCSA
mmetsp:Transcript_40618/g.72979  ORF Transcript_40618/g.72979 Transcript_40618/m.72979 type:complete len:404 (-) Transcript_40618:640-1851(-)